MIGSRHHKFDLTWGADALADGTARFRLWAPGQESVKLYAEASGELVEMTGHPDGWYEVTTDVVPLHTGYMFELPDGTRVPDPAARAQIADVHGPSQLVDPLEFPWPDAEWQGRPWHETVLYELHVGTFTPRGTFDAVARKLDHLAETGVTAIELMPVAQFGGNRGWGYDGVLLYAPHVAYGGPEGLKRLVGAAHARGLMVFLDVVYNHFGPDGNYLHLYAPQFFNEERHTPWGAAIAYEREPVRRFVIDNALYWLEEYRIDGLRLDAVDQIDDQSSEPILQELASEVRKRITEREVHLTTEDDRNITELHERDEDKRPVYYSGEWNDDFHHVAHVVATGEDEGYYEDYAQQPVEMLARSLAEGYVYQGEPSPFRDDAPRGVSSAHLPPTVFVNFIQNHDQIGNRAVGERLTKLAEPQRIEVLLAILLLNPNIPLLYMGEEWAEQRPFLFFTDFHGKLAKAVYEGRSKEFGKWTSFLDHFTSNRIPDPNAMKTFEASRLDWAAADEPQGRARRELVKQLLDIRKREIMPRLAGIAGKSGRYQLHGGSAFSVAWRLGDGSTLRLSANVGDEPGEMPEGVIGTGESRLLFEWPADAAAGLDRRTLPGWSIAFRLNE